MSVGGGGPTAGLLNDTTRAGLQASWPERIEEANLLLQASLRSMGVGLKVYAFEVRIKARICEYLDLDLLPRACKTHDLTELIIFTGLMKELSTPANRRVKEYWDTLAKFSKLELGQLRYQTRVQLADSQADELLEALDDPIDGIFAWLSRPR